MVLGGRPVFHTVASLPPFLLLTASQVTGIAAYLRAADFDDLWRHARTRLLRPYRAGDAEREVRGLYAATHRDLTAFYAQSADYGDAVVKWLVP